MAQADRQKRVDITAVARRARVSPSTVSRFFNHPELVRADTRKRIELACEKLGYLRNRSATALRGLRSATVGLVVPTVDNAIFAEMIQAFADHLNARDLTMLMGSHGYDLEMERRLVRSLLEHRVDGIAVIGLEHLGPTEALLRGQGVAAVALWNWDEAAPVSCVGPSNAEAGELAARHLIELGHREIAFQFPDLAGNDRARGRFEGAMAACREAGISIPVERIRTTPYNVADAKVASLDLLRQQGRPTAAICGNDVIARGVVFAAQALELRLPEDFSVVGIGDFAGSAEMEPGLTSVRMPARQIGRLGAQTLLEMIETGDPHTPRRHRIELSLIKRRSTGRPPEGGAATHS